MTDTYVPELNEKIVQAWFGGSFDPIHNGHLLAAQDLLEQLHLDTLNFTPCYLSPLKQKTACSSQHRVNMLRLAIEDCAQFSLDLRELEREGNSYTVETLAQLRAEKGEAACLLWVVGWDAFLSLPSWHRWREIFDFCNVVVVNRPGFAETIPGELQHWCNAREVIQEELKEFNFGKVVFLNTRSIEISSSTIRERCARGLPIRFMLPPKVEQYIFDNQLFL